MILSVRQRAAQRAIAEAPTQITGAIRYLPSVNTGPLAIHPSRETVIQAATVNPACHLSLGQRSLHLAGIRASMIGGLVQLPDGMYEMYDLFYHEMNPSRIMARVRTVTAWHS